MSALYLANYAKTVETRLNATNPGSAASDSWALISGLLGFEKLDVIREPLLAISDGQRQQVEDALALIQAGMPLYRLLGWREFYGLKFYLNSATLEPRSDSEILIERLLAWVKSQHKSNSALNILDIGTGSGALIITLLCHLKQAKGTGVDISQEALAMATQNATTHNVAARFRPLHSDVFEEVCGQFDIILSNPPYIPTGVIATLGADVRSYDPTIALDGGEDGLEFYKTIAKNSAPFLSANAIIGVEIGYDQKEAVSQIFKAQGYQLLESAKDLQHQDRVLVFCRA